MFKWFNFQASKHFALFFFLLPIFVLRAQINLIPHPASIITQKGTFYFNENTTIFDAENRAASLFNERLNFYCSFQCKKTNIFNLNNQIIFRKDTNLNSEAYKITINNDSVLILLGPGAENNAVSTLMQIIIQKKSGKGYALPACIIDDAPQYTWRGMHLDVSRHFFPTSFIKKYIELLSLHKLNTFHWHLTDDQGWRIEIKKYPYFTQVGAWREGSMIGHYNEQKFDTLRYGGFYTQDDIRDVVEFAKQRNVTVVPEIEMPGHSLAALSAYPKLACMDTDFSTAKKWGVFEDVYCTKEETFSFLEDVLSEVCELFPSEYIHIGGDEVLKNRWKSCRNCQARMKEEGLKTEEELQSYFVQRIEKFLNSKGKKIIGWDEILEGGLAPNAAVMSWRGTKGGEAAAKAGHHVVMSPGSHCYFDHYQSNPEFEPTAIGGFTTVEKVYSYEPTPAYLSEKEKKFILGAQANVWTEYINTSNDVERMAFPRMCALAEVVWSPKELRNWSNFANRLDKHHDFLKKSNINFSNSFYDILYESVKLENNFGIALRSQMNGKIYYTTNGKNPTTEDAEYKSPILMKENQLIKASLFVGGERLGKNFEKIFYANFASGKKIHFKTPPSEYYSGDNGFYLVNGVLESQSGRREKCTGWCNKNPCFIIDLGDKKDIRKITLHFLDDKKNKIYAPENFLVNTGNKLKSTSKTASFKSTEKNETTITHYLNDCSSQFIRIEVLNPPQNTNSDVWILLDEITIE